MPDCALPIRDTTDLLYSSARDRGQRTIFWAALTGRSRCLLSLEEVRQRCHVSTSEQSQLEDETQMVPIARILGSEGRCGDFDRDFNPLREHNRGRWLRIAAARRRGTPLPPVKLVQVGDLYFVQDGHHRISVARALGQPEIEARVTVWQAIGPLPWETQTERSDQGASESRGWKALVGRLRGGLLASVGTLKTNQRGGAAHVGL